MTARFQAVTAAMTATLAPLGRPARPNAISEFAISEFAIADHANAELAIGASQ